MDPAPCLPGCQVPLGKVNLEGLGAILQHYRGRYNTVVGVQVRCRGSISLLQPPTLS